ncbi:MAG: Trehalose import ATP-binding protein SugC [Chloroflexi bacterium ADurb.Bin120]|jgi:iron(III) transport system ATP-binding protein|uniref:Trehalose/maltose import ATP-binding protein MalK n=1 Tax=Candidatus Brevifilum fermentans TaxID=1986204 RepID=A0A1Y6K9N8_9CHLR|nr:ABC transporter ATP-binding protein [Brevefilum fermentans]OQB83809.1 MAG: Trehalose import ATP-binding protein SugC [Chloroflexi bacterium ADurb.Bin120]SMX55289.1 Trehalose/maltose import ATP-binding protein MalK [Brevefilum fermentans]HOM66800.1 ABC transporter ATP-binding protein [Brevefilum fermentans]
MAQLELSNISKSYNKVTVVQDFNIKIADGEFLTLLGPSGCGKTTTLRMVAGFTEPTTGSILLDGKPIFSTDKKISLAPEQRDMGMVFQSYAVWPHMNVFKNVAYPLKFKKFSQTEVRQKVSEVLNLVKLSGFEDRMPDQLSGGQQQRVALARALVMEPKVLLLDEPLSNLDAKLRESMRFEIVELQKRLSMTVFYVTHDQTEAMSMSDRIVVMQDGFIKQIGSPREIYQKPNSQFVAGFIGLANFIPCIVDAITSDHARVKLLDGSSDHFLDVPVIPNMFNLGEEAIMMVRTEDVEILPFDQGGTRAVLVRQNYLGDKSDCLLKLGPIEIRANIGIYAELENGQEVKLTFSNPIILKK